MTTIINNIENTRTIIKLITKLMSLNNKSLDTYDYLHGETIVMDENPNSGYAYAYLQDNPSISVCKHPSLDKLMNKACNKEVEIRGEDYDNEATKSNFIEYMERKGWTSL